MDDITRIIILKDEVSNLELTIDFLERQLNFTHNILCNENYYSDVEKQRNEYEIFKGSF